MDREYLDEDLRRLAIEPGFEPAGWNAREISEFHRLIQCARAAYADTDLRNMRVLRIKPDGSNGSSRARAALSSGREIALTFKNAGSMGVVVLGFLTSETEA